MDEIRTQINKLFGDTLDLPKLSKQDLLALKLRTAREIETRRIASQDRAIEQIRTLAALAGIEVAVRAPASPLRTKLARAGKCGS